MGFLLSSDLHLKPYVTNFTFKTHLGGVEKVLN